MGNWYWLKRARLGFLFLLPSSHAASTEVVTYYYSDPQGTVLAEADMQGHITATFDYAPYGNLLMGTAKDGPGYTGHTKDFDTGFIYMQARYYDPMLARFVSIDPIMPRGGDAFNFNRYAYANNSPARYVDRDGRKAGDLFATPEMAALDVLIIINPISISDNHEYAGYIVLKDGMFIATTPVQMSETGGVIPGDSPPGAVGDYHTHGAYSKGSRSHPIVVGSASEDKFNSDNYSGDDFTRYDAMAVGLERAYRGYLATPGGFYKIWAFDRNWDLEGVVDEQKRKAAEKDNQDQQKRDRQQAQQERQQARYLFQ